MSSESEFEEVLLEDLPPSINPYETLGVAEDAEEREIRAVYRKLALKCHPDKVSPSAKEEAHITFQNLAFAYAIVSDPVRRARYDSTGSTAETLEDDSDFSWREFYRAQFADAFTDENINKFKDEYQGGPEERSDLLASYSKYEGDLNAVFRTVMLSSVLDDEDRFRAIIDQAIADGEVKAWDAYVHEPAKERKQRRKNAEREAKEAEQHAADLDLRGKKQKTKKKAATTAVGGDLGDLQALIQQRQQSRGMGFLDRLEEKWAGEAAKAQSKGKKGKKRTALDEPPEELFTANRAAGTGKGKKARRD